MKKKPWLLKTPGEQENNLFIIGLVFLGLFLLLVLLLQLFPGMETKLALPGECGWRRLFGIPCPGCGGTRAAKALARGKLLISLHYHAAVPAAAFLGLLYLAVYLLNRLSSGRIKCIAWKWFYLYLIGGITLAQWIVKLIWGFEG